MVEHGWTWLEIYMDIYGNHGNHPPKFRHLCFWNVNYVRTCFFCCFISVSTWLGPKEFVYVRKVCGPNGPYEMELMPFQEVSLASYTTLSPAGLSHYVNGVPVGFVPLQRWLNERESYRALRKLRFFQARIKLLQSQLVIQPVIPVNHGKSMVNHGKSWWFNCCGFFWRLRIYHDLPTMILPWFYPLWFTMAVWKLGKCQGHKSANQRVAISLTF